jgi:hypothetical protein
METKNFYLDLQKAIEIAVEERYTNLSGCDTEKLLCKYIEKYYHHGDGEIVLIHQHKNACEAADMLRWVSYNEAKLPVKTSIHNGEVFATGILNKDIDWKDTDPYETAGGYKAGIAKKGTTVVLKIEYTYTGFHISVIGNVNITYDHYNNNICGVSTNNGTRKYEIGECVEVETIIHNYWLSSFDIEFDMFDVEKLRNFIYSQK